MLDTPFSFSPPSTTFIQFISTRRAKPSIVPPLSRLRLPPEVARGSDSFELEPSSESSELEPSKSFELESSEPSRI